jgi:DnaK suppressor protein
MYTSRQRLEHDLSAVIERLRHLEGTVAIDELPGPIGINSPFADEVDDIQASHRREIDCATRALLMGRLNLLSAAIDRLDEGEHGTCVECGEPISPVRLHVVPEVQACVRCQNRWPGAGERGAADEWPQCAS